MSIIRYIIYIYIYIYIYICYIIYIILYISYTLYILHTILHITKRYICIYIKSDFFFFMYRNTINIHFGLKIIKILIYKRNLHTVCKSEAKHKNKT